MKALMNLFAGPRPEFFRYLARFVFGETRRASAARRRVRSVKTTDQVRERVHSARDRVSPALLGQALDTVSEGGGVKFSV